MKKNEKKHSQSNFLPFFGGPWPLLRDTHTGQSRPDMTRALVGTRWHESHRKLERRSLSWPGQTRQTELCGVVVDINTFPPSSGPASKAVSVPQRQQQVRPDVHRTSRGGASGVDFHVLLLASRFLVALFGQIPLHHRQPQHFLREFSDPCKYLWRNISARERERETRLRFWRCSPKDSCALCGERIFLNIPPENSFSGNEKSLI